MLLHYLVHFTLINFLAHFVQRRHYVCLGDVAGVVGVKLLEDGGKFVFVEEHLNIKRGSQELGVIDFVIPEVVHLVYDLLYLLCR